jgi:hypothetical protein
MIPLKAENKFTKLIRRQVHRPHHLAQLLGRRRVAQDKLVIGLRRQHRGQGHQRLLAQAHHLHRINGFALPGVALLVGLDSLLRRGDDVQTACLVAAGKSPRMGPVRVMPARAAINSLPSASQPRPQKTRQ